MKIRLFFLLILLLCPFHFRAQNASADSLEIMKRSHGFRTTQLILPASLIAVGAVGVSTPWFRSLNREVRDGLAEWRDGRYFHADDYIQYVPVIANFGLSLLGAKARHSYVDRVLITATSYAAMGIMVNGVKWIVDEQRPDGTAFNSFPSGHTLSSFVAATIIMHHDKRLGIAAYVFASIIAFSRLYLYVHFPTDILAGALLGIIIGLIVCKFFNILSHNHLSLWEAKK